MIGNSGSRTVSFANAARFWAKALNGRAAAANERNERKPRRWVIAGTSYPRQAALRYFTGMAFDRWRKVEGDLHTEIESLLDHAVSETDIQTLPARQPVKSAASKL